MFSRPDLISFLSICLYWPQLWALLSLALVNFGNKSNVSIFRIHIRDMKKEEVVRNSQNVVRMKSECSQNVFRKKLKCSQNVVRM